MVKRYHEWINMIAYPNFDVAFLSDKSLFWRIEANHPFHTVIKSEEVLKINNYYHEPIIIRNGLWGSRIFLEPKQLYSIGIKYRSNIRLYMGLYYHGSNIPVKNWVLNPTVDNQSLDNLNNQAVDWKDYFYIQDNFDTNVIDINSKPLHLKIIIPDTGGEFIEISELFLVRHEDIETVKIDIESGLNATPNDSNLPEIAVGIVTYNRKNHISALLNQMKSINYPADKLKIFVVDNASTDGTDTLLEKEFPEVNVLKNSENLGGSGGFNRFFTHLASMDKEVPPFGWLIDDDAVVDKNTLIYLVRTIINDDSIAVAGSVMMDLENPSTVYEAGGDLFKDSFGWNANILHTDASNLLHVNEKTWESGYAGAYSLLFRTELIHKVGIWRNYFLHVDDCEWSLRIKRLTGKRVVIALDSLIWHVLQGSKKPFTTLRYYETRNFLDYFSGCKSVETSYLDNTPSGVSLTEPTCSEYDKSQYVDKKPLLKVMIQTTLMGLKQLVIKRDDLCHFHIKGIDDFFEGRFGKQPLERSALFFPDIKSLFDEYKNDQNNRGRYPKKAFIVREINRYMNDGVDYEGDIISKIREISPQTVIVEASTHHNIRNPFLLKMVVMVKMVIAFFFPSKGIVILPFWSESVIPNNIAKYTAVFENGQYSLYKANRIKAVGNTLKILWKSSLNALKIVRNKFNPKASHVSF
ncbi:MAG: glycosyltransferase family 2 protein [Desulfamplus sp.]|nr:glycosyltransferase family 2 protein [Desulfamplus sp.]